ncbi:hypothetical protein VM1G_00658 [Cytospora mali]|uniref:Uncharacterized protein n=1 Tax=Cytospora mali TaxID=578113 RepID=A0A194VJZ2_CYTMA|nr:hypothetical protein VM1G_00658 [Valsa mali]
MESEPDLADVELLLEAIKGRQKLPRAFATALQLITEAGKETTERIFFDYGGPSAWAAYKLTKRSADCTGHVSGKGKRQRLITRLEGSTVESRQRLARELAVAIAPSERVRIERILKSIKRARRRADGRDSSVESLQSTGYQVDAVDNQTASIPPTPNRPSAPPSYCQPRPSNNREAALAPAEIFSSNQHVLADASVSACMQLFPTYLAGAIRRNLKMDNTFVAAAVAIALPYRQWTGCMMRLEVISSKVNHIAWELFGAQLEVDKGYRYIYLPGGSRVAPDPRLVLKGCRFSPLRQFFGTQVAEAILATRLCQRDIQEGRDQTSCISMTLTSDLDGSAEIYILLRLKEGALLRDKLYA